MDAERVETVKKIHVKQDFQERFRKNGHSCTIVHKLVDPIKFGFRYVAKNRSTKLRRFLAELCIVDEKNPVAIDFFRSQLALDGEKIRHIKRYLFVIHPFSRLLTYWQNIMIMVYFVNIIYLSLYLSILQKHYAEYYYYSSVMVIVSEQLCLLDILSKFNIGFHLETKNHICLRRRDIAIRYLKGFFLLDFLAWIPVEFISGPFRTSHVVHDDIFLVFRIRRFFLFLDYMKQMMKRFSCSLTTSRVITITVIALFFLHCVNALQFAVTYLKEGSYNPKNPDPDSWMSLLKVWDADPVSQYFYGMFRAVLLFTYQGLNMDTPRTSEDQIFAAVIWVASLIFTTYSVSIIIFTVSGEEFATARYYSLINQLNTYMERKELPQELRQKLLHYYQIRYNDCFFSEREILESISGGLLHEVTMHSCRRVINNVPFLKFLPDDMLIEVVSALRLQIFLPNEIVVRVGNLADMIYFIVKGTVAVYSCNGLEAVHLHDGDYFGELSLIGGPRFRRENVVAVSPCEMLCLGTEPFTRAAARHPELLADMIRRASERVEKIYDVDKDCV